MIGCSRGIDSTTLTALDEVDTAEHDHVRIRGRRFLRQTEGVAQKVTYILDLPALTIVAEDDRLELLLARPDAPVELGSGQSSVVERGRQDVENSAHHRTR